MLISKNKNFWVFAAALTIIILLGCAYRIYNINYRSLEYDEIWTLTHYASTSIITIFTDLSTPNNHPINSLLIKFLTFFLGDANYVIRLPALISGILLLCVVPMVTFMLFKDYFIVIISTALCAFNGGLIHFSQTARGYEIQTLLIVLFILVILIYERKNSFYLPILIMILPILSIFTISTSILFLLPLVLLHLVYCLFFKGQVKGQAFVRRLFLNRKILYCYTILLGFSLIWYLINLKQFQIGQTHGAEINSLLSFWSFLLRTFQKLVGWFILALSILLFISGKKHLKIAFAYLLVLFFPIINCFIFKAGPPRVYLPFIPVISIASAAGMCLFARKTFSKIFTYKKTLGGLASFVFVLFLCLNAGSKISSWTPYDWPKEYNSLSQKFPPNCYICLPVTSGYPAVYKNKNAIIENFKRTPSSEYGFPFILFPVSREISGITKDGNSEIIFIPNNITAISKYLDKINIYHFESISKVNNPKIVIASIQPMRSEKVNAIIGFFINVKNSKWIILNSWMKGKFYYLNKKSFSAAVLASNKPGLSIKQMLMLEKRSNGRIKFFALE